MLAILKSLKRVFSRREKNRAKCQSCSNLIGCLAHGDAPYAPSAQVCNQCGEVFKVFCPVSTLEFSAFAAVYYVDIARNHPLRHIRQAAKAARKACPNARTVAIDIKCLNCQLKSYLSFPLPIHDE